jgi:hypothetical protein
MAGVEECPVCLRLLHPLTSKLMAGCNHAVCTGCAMNVLLTALNASKVASCPVCRSPQPRDYQDLRDGEVAPLAAPPRTGDPSSAHGILSSEAAVGGGGGARPLPSAVLIPYADLVFAKDLRGANEVLGTGRCGNVVAASWYGSQVAVKCLPMHTLGSSPEMRTRATDALRRELYLLTKIRHPCILTVYGCEASSPRA